MVKEIKIDNPAEPHEPWLQYHYQNRIQNQPVKNPVVIG